MPRSVYRNRLIPTKILAFLLYGQYPWLDRRAGGLVQVKLGPLARTIRISSLRLRDALKHLQTIGILQDIQFTYGKALLRVSRPLLSWEGVDQLTSPETSQIPSIADSRPIGESGTPERRTV